MNTNVLLLQPKTVSLLARYYHAFLYFSEAFYTSKIYFGWPKKRNGKLWKIGTNGSEVKWLISQDYSKRHYLPA